MVDGAKPISPPPEAKEGVFFHRREDQDLASKNNFVAARGAGFIQNRLAMQHNISLPAPETRLESVKVRRGDTPMGLARPLNALMFCAAFVFVGALIVGVIP